MRSTGRRNLTWLALALFLALLAWCHESIHLLLVARSVTPAELALSESGWKGDIVPGYAHRWKPYPVCVGTWVFHYGKTAVVHSKIVYGPDGKGNRCTVWSPDGTISEQRDGETIIDHAPWKWGETDQLTGTKQLRGCLLINMRLDDLDLRGFDLRETRLANTTFHDADLEGADLAGAHLTAADFSTARNLDLEQVLSARSWNLDPFGKSIPTRFPPDIERELTRRGLRHKTMTPGALKFPRQPAARGSNRTSER